MLAYSRRTESTLKEVATEIEGFGVKVAYATADVSSKEQVESSYYDP